MRPLYIVLPLVFRKGAFILRRSYFRDLALQCDLSTFCFSTMNCAEFVLYAIIAQRTTAWAISAGATYIPHPTIQNATPVL